MNVFLNCGGVTCLGLLTEIVRYRDRSEKADDQHDDQEFNKREPRLSPLSVSSHHPSLIGMNGVFLKIR